MNFRTSCWLFIFFCSLISSVSSQEPSETLTRDQSRLVSVITNEIVVGLNPAPRLLKSFSVPRQAVGLALSQNGDRIAYTHDDELTVAQLDGATTSFKMPFTPTGKVTVHFSPNADAPMVAIADERHCCVFDCLHRNAVVNKSIDSDQQKYIDWSVSPNGRFMAAMTTRGHFQLVNLMNNSITNYPSLSEEYDYSKCSIAINNDGKRLQLVDRDDAIVSIEFGEDAQPPSASIARFPVTLGSKLSAGSGMFGAARPNRLTISSYDGTERRWAFGDFSPISAQLVNHDGHECLVVVGKPTMRTGYAVMGIKHAPPRSLPVWFVHDQLIRDVMLDVSGKHLAYRTGNTIRVFETPSNSYTQGRSDTLRLLSNPIAKKDFDVVEQVSDKLYPDTLDTKSPRPFEHFEHWMTILREAAEASEQGRPNDGQTPPEFLSQWHASKPRSRYAKILLAQWHLDHAWKSRGDAIASQLSREQLMTFEFHLGEASSVIGDFTEPETPPQLLAVAVDVAKGLGWPPEKRLQLFKKLEEFPDYKPAHYKAVESLLPRWGGSIESVESYVEAACERAGGIKRNSLYASLTLHLMVFFPTKEFFEVFHFDRDRMMSGLVLLNPTSELNSSGLSNFLLWLAVNQEMDKASRLLEHLESHTVYFAPPLDDENVAKSISKAVKLHQVRKRSR